MNIGLQITKNKEKYNHLLDLLISNNKTLKNLNFIFIEDEEALKKEMKSLDALVCYEINEEAFSNRTDSLKWIHFGVAGVDKSLFQDIIKSKVVLTNASGIHAGPVSEFVMSNILYFSKQFDACYDFKSHKEWRQWNIAKQMVQLKNKTVGIIGFGCIGKAIAKKAKAFNMNVIAVRRLQKKEENKKTIDRLLPMDKIDELYKQSDYIVIACPLTKLTHHLIGKDEFKKMKQEAIIINIARGQIINELDLIIALKNKTIYAAALDVFEKEPLSPTSDLFKLKNVFLSPHISGNFPEYQLDMMLQFGKNLTRYVAGKSVFNRICKKRLY